MIHLILLSGGSGSRLWPLSNNTRSKQFLKVLRDENGNPVSMVQRVYSQIKQVDADIDITIATCESQQNSIETQIDGDYSLVLEPERRDTAPAIMLACAHLELVQGARSDDTVIVMPIDTFADQGYYDRISALNAAVQAVVADLVLLGVEPTYPSEKYGYIIPEADSGDVRAVCEFKEKPETEAARQYISKGALWNCGVFAFRLSYLRDLSTRYANSETYEGFVAAYGLLPKNSFDYEVVEKAGSIAVVPYSGTWKDIGTWNTLTEEMAEPVQGRAVVDDVSNVHVINETGLPLVVAGLEDAVVVATHDGILACTKAASAQLKKQVEAVSETRPMYEKRRWGEYRVLDSQVFSGCNSLTKELVISSGNQLSYQRHSYRSEVWTVVSGSGEAVLEGEIIKVELGSVIDIKPLQKHAVRSLDELHIIEVQLGDSLVEEDIERFGYYWEDQC